jgi:putative restriction endonuclease
MATKDYTYYRDCFAHLHTAHFKGLMAPHKPLLLLSVIDLVERGLITTPRIYLNDDLQKAFQENVNRFMGYSMIFKRPEIGKPFYHMQHEPFWYLVRLPDAIEPDRPTYAVSRLQSIYRYALIDLELFRLMRNAEARAQLRVLLVSTYFSALPCSMAKLVAAPIWGAVMGWIA